ncbi:uncharacterized protein PITG_00480 [Phytophthora infestans T30-4]|uniref:Tudor domain-containing protein n=1 Tax=Phytophthora infestans (strain T30-4) TaxID=403677 RepID=D0MQX4_PHYIT|nr:uncharacterized protein PITG_00480 [Phytophthora infestans T30-4]EEY57893.1 conserved hypothetical protein [Phytophthora infestans T30-4]|eukprot:XP_002909079.1 conserved hypothetical protein [Phytophthora infestans T30-4]
MASSSECSTDFEGPGSAVSGSTTCSAASEEQEYDEDDFDNYSDSFELDNEDTEPEVSAAVAVVRSTGHDQLQIGIRVQVFWRDENQWFAGVIRSVEEGNEPCYNVHYDDGEQQWELQCLSCIRPFPVSIAGTAECTQLQQMLPLNAHDARAMIGKRAVVYWSDEGEWYNGIISAAQASPAAVKIDYDDGAHVPFNSPATPDDRNTANASTFTF